MSRSSGVKRKSVDDESTNLLQVPDLLHADLEHEISNLINDIRCGSHPELVRRSASLQQLKEKQIASCDRHRKEQIKNINQLFEYEVEDANALYERALEEMKDHLVSDVLEESAKLKNTQKKLLLESGQKHTEGKSGTRSLRSSLPESANSEIKSKSKRKSRDPPAPVIEAIPEASRRADLLEIVRDLQQQTGVWKEKAKLRERSIEVSSDESGISIDDTKIFIGDQVEMTSHVSGESFIGILTTISATELVIRTGTGSRLLFHLAMLRNNRYDLKICSLT